MIRDLINIIFPRTCHLCGGSLTAEERFICTSCTASLPRSGLHRQPRNSMEQRFDGLFPYERATGHFLYSRDSPMATLVHDFKYRKFPGLAHRLGEITGEELIPTGFFDGIDLIIPIPVHYLKRAIRGYNQTDHIARGLSAATGIPVGNNLRAVRSHPTQTARTPAERRRNTDGVFGVVSPTELTGKHILLTDDVCTTGATLTSAAEAILQANPSVRLTLLTLAVTF